MLATFLVAVCAFGEETIAPFAKQWLGLDLDLYPIGKVVDTNADFAAVGPLSTHTLIGTNGTEGVVWYSPKDPRWTRQTFCRRDIYYGLREGRLIAVRLFMPAIGNGQGSFEQRNGKISRLNFEDGRYRIQYAADCSSDPESLVAATIQFTLVENPR
jgi:hypothetical protein